MPEKEIREESGIMIAVAPAFLCKIAFFFFLLSFHVEFTSAVEFSVRVVYKYEKITVNSFGARFSL